MIRFSEKGGKETEIPVHHKLEELLDQYLETSGLKNRPNAPPFPIALGKVPKRWKWHSGSLAMLIVGRRSSTIGVVRGFYSKTWSGFDISGIARTIFQTAIRSRRTGSQGT
jgi:hypothetical protein